MGFPAVGGDVSGFADACCTRGEVVLPVRVAECIASVVGQCAVKPEVIARAGQQGTGGINGDDIATDRDPRGIADREHLHRLVPTAVIGHQLNGATATRHNRFAEGENDVARNTDTRSPICWAEGGDGGGEIIAEGTPEEVANNKKSYTGKYLKPYLK